MKTPSVVRILLLTSVFGWAANGVLWSQNAPAPATAEPSKQQGADGSAPQTGNGTISSDKSDVAATTRKEANEKIAIHDILAITVREDGAKLNGYYRVDPRGMIVLGYAGAIAVEGLTGSEAAAKIKELLEAKFLQKATVAVEVNVPMPTKAAGLSMAPPPNLGTVWVMGQVNNKGQQPIPPNQNFTVSKAILQAGIAQFAKLSKTKLVRMVNGKREEMIINVHDVIYKGKIDADVPVQKDDWIIVPQGMFPDPS